MRLRLVAVVLGLLCVASLGAASEPWAWAGVFDLVGGEKYTLSAAKASSGEYAARDMKFVIMSTESADQAGIDAAKSAAETQWQEQRPVTGKSGGLLPGMAWWSWSSTSSVSEYFILKFDQNSWVSLFQFAVPFSGPYAFFMESNPMHFETDFHYLKDKHGDDIEPAFVEGVEESDNKKWGLAIFGAFLTTLPAVFMVAVFKTGTIVDGNVLSALFAFASGAIFACAVFLLLSEALFLASAGQDEVTGTWTWGFSILLGWVLSLIIKHASDVIFGPQDSEVSATASLKGTIVAVDAQTGGSNEDVTTEQAPLARDPVSEFSVPAGFFHPCMRAILKKIFWCDVQSSATNGVGDGLKPSSIGINSENKGTLSAAKYPTKSNPAVQYGQSEELCDTELHSGGILMNHVVTNDMPGKLGTTHLDSAVDPSLKTETKTIKMGVIGPVLVGDFFHNFVDGIVIGFAAKDCNSSFVWTIVASTVAHEIPQEIADFVILIKKANMKWYLAAIANYASSFSTVVGALVGHGIDVSSNVEGWGLAFGAGVYLYVAITDLAPQLADLRKGGMEGLIQSLLTLLAFAVGATCVGLVLLNHKHCEPETAATSAPSAPSGGGDPHEGHHHR